MCRYIIKYQFNLTMKRSLFITIIAAALFTSSHGFAYNDSDGSFGISASVGVSVPSDWHGNGMSLGMYSPGYEFSVGGVYNKSLGNGFYFEPGLSLFYYHFTYDDVYVFNNDNRFNSYDPDIYKVGLRVPLMFGWGCSLTDRIGLTFFTGPELSYAFAGDVDSPHEYSDVDNLFELQRRFDCAWKTGVGLPINRFVISVEASVGISDLLKTDMTYHENRVSATLKYFF